MPIPRQLTDSLPAADKSCSTSQHVDPSSALVDVMLAGQLQLVRSAVLGVGRSLFVFEHLNSSVLTLRERQLLTTASSGAANKLIALEHALSFSVTSTKVKRAVSKLGFVHLSQFLATAARLRTPRGSRQVVQEAGRVCVMFCDDDRLVTDELLTRAEREVVAELLRGASSATIASLRHTSIHTVSNQLRAIYRKLGVSSRRELAVRYGQPSAGAA